ETPSLPYYGQGKRKQSEGLQIQTSSKKPRTESTLSQFGYDGISKKVKNIYEKIFKQQELFENFVKSLKGLNSFCSDQYFFNGSPGSNPTLTSLIFLDFCKKNTGITK